MKPSLPPASGPRRPETGGVAVLTAIMLLVALVMAGFALDLSNARSDTTLADSAADSGALAGAQSLPDASAARADASSYATTSLNGGETGTGSTITVTTPYSMSGNPYPAARLVNVRVCWDSPTGFAAAFGFSSVNVCGSATAYKVGGTPCALCVLAPSDRTLSIAGNGVLSVTGGDVHVNSNGTPAAGVDGAASGGVTTDGVIRILGTYQQPNPGTFSPTPITGVPAIADPLTDVPAPSVAGPFRGSVSNSSSDLTIQPGIYDSISSSSTGRLTFAPGIYVIRQGLSLSKSSSAPVPSVVGDGVLLYFACASYPTPCTPGQSGAGISMSGSTTFSFSGPTSGPYTNMVIFSDRNNTASHTLLGGALNQITGTVYARSGHYYMSGNSGSLSHNGAVIVGRATTTGAASFSIAFDTDYAHPSLGRNTILVE
ncbi:MAG TPA: Tad domain-containing protein [Actinomycetota bacterium]